MLMRTMAKQICLRISNKLRCDLRPCIAPLVKAMYSVFVSSVLLIAVSANEVTMEWDTRDVLSMPVLSRGDPAAERMFKVTSAEYSGTEVYHTVYLPERWTPTGSPLPIIFEYTGNYFPRSGSTGKVKDAGLGYGLSGGRYIWVSLPYIHENGNENQVTWWGDTSATVEYAKTNVPRVIRKYNADPDAVFLCGFSRGAIGVNYLGLHDDEIATLWTGFITHDHFDGVRDWGKTDWGSPLSKYRVEAAERLRRVGGRPYLVCQNGDNYGSEAFVREVLGKAENFTFLNVPTIEIFGSFPHALAKAPHTDMWLLLPSVYRTEAWDWMNRAVAGSRKEKRGRSVNH